MKNKEFIVEFINDWYALTEMCNWYTLNLINIYIEHEKWLRAYSFQFVILGIGVYIRFNYDIKFLEKKLKSFD